MKKNKNSRPRLRSCPGMCIAAIAIVAGCARDLQMTGGGSDTEISGRVVAENGVGAAGAAVALIDTAYDPGFDGPLPPERITVADATGSYRFDSLKAGQYNIVASNTETEMHAIVYGIEATTGQTTKAKDALLGKTARLRILLPDSLAEKPAHISAPGTMLAITCTGSGNVAEFDTVPQGILPVIRYKKASTDAGIVLFLNVAIPSAETVVLNPHSYNEISGAIPGLSGDKQGVSVSLIPRNHNPAFDTALPGKLNAVTGEDGIYRFYNIDRGEYNLSAAHAASGLKIVFPCTVDSLPSIKVPDAALKGTATLIVPLPDSLQVADGRVYLPGTFAVVQSQAAVKTATFESIAQGTYRSIVFQHTGASPAVTLFKNVVIDSAGVFVLDPWASWSHVAKIRLNTTASGANIQETLLKFPILVRLTATNFDFSQAKPQGEDLRITTSGGSPLAFEIERWDSAGAAAEIWIKTDTVFGNDNADSRFLLMRWGNPDAGTKSNSGAVFDTADGFRGVWHLRKTIGKPQPDATFNHYDGEQVEMTGSSDKEGVIAKALEFDGSSQCIAVREPPPHHNKLDVQDDSAYTVSAWVYTENQQNDSRVIVSKGRGQYGFMVNDKQKWMFYAGRYGLGVDTTTTAPASFNAWTLLTGVRMGKRQYLYVNNSLADSTADAAGVNASISNKYYDLIIGRQSDDESDWFEGLIDEVRVSGKAYGAGWIKLCYANQKPDQKFVTIERMK